jgi:hypothetical protein
LTSKRKSNDELAAVKTKLVSSGHNVNIINIILDYLLFINK